MGPPLAAAASVRGLERIYRDHHARGRWVLRARGVDECQIDDCVHDVFLAIHRRLGSRSTDVPLVMWLDGVARNVAFSHRRSLGTRHRGEAALPEAEPPRMPDDELARAEAWLSLAKFLAELPLEQREVFVLVEVLGLSMTEVAQDMAAPINTLYSRLRLARKRFGERFSVIADDHAATQAFLRRAQEEARPTASKARRIWALVAVDIGHAVHAAGVGAIAGALGGLAIAAGILASVGGLALADPPRKVEPALAVTRTSAPSAAIAPLIPEPVPEPIPVPIAVAAPPVEQNEPPPIPQPPSRSARASRVAPPPARAVDSSAQIDLLHRARAVVGRRPNEALALLDEYAAYFGRGVLDRERFLIERDAACRADRIDRARKAAAVLVTLDVRVQVEDPCTAN
jgi:RNA polymerase sigma-70 factor (ECF subfamily)